MQKHDLPPSSLVCLAGRTIQSWIQMLAIRRGCEELSGIASVSDPCNAENGCAGTERDRAGDQEKHRRCHMLGDQDAADYRSDDRAYPPDSERPTNTGRTQRRFIEARTQ